MGDNERTEEGHQRSETAQKISERYGVPKEEVDAIITNRPIQPGAPHPMTMGSLMKDSHTSTGSYMTQPHSRWSPAAIVGIVLGILGILAIATLLVYILREPRKVEVVMQEPPAEVIPPEPDTVFIEPIAEPAPEPAPAPKPAVRRRTAPAPVLSTSNSLEAEERLAELKAAGNSKARITRVTRGGTTIYQVRR